MINWPVEIIDYIMLLSHDHHMIVTLIDPHIKWCEHQNATACMEECKTH